MAESGGGGRRLFTAPPAAAPGGLQEVRIRVSNQRGSVPSSGAELPPVVTATRVHGSTGVAVELDGREWRVVPIWAAARAGLAVGATLDRARARELNRALRVERARTKALRLARFGDHSRASMDARLADRHVAAAERQVVVAELERVGVIDDRRHALERARRLSRRGYGNEAILDDLTQRGLNVSLCAEAVEALPDEPERVAEIVAARGLSRATVVYLGRRGFSSDALEPLIAGLTDHETPDSQ